MSQISHQTPLGYVLSGSTTQFFRFVVAEEAEDIVSEGMYVLAKGPNKRILGVIEELQYYNEFYEERDIWVEAIKKGRRPPEGIGRAFFTSKARIVGEIKGNDIVPPRQPLKPGSIVYRVTGSDLVPVFDHDPRDRTLPKHLLSLGTLYGYNDLNALIDLRALTMHIGIIGTTGSGKTNTVSVLLEELGNKDRVDTGITKLPKTVPAVVMDLNADYIYLFDNPELVPRYTEVIRLVSKESPAYHSFEETRMRGRRIVPLTLDLNVFEPHELAEVIVSLYKGGLSEGSMLQINLLTYVFDELVPKNLGEGRLNVIFYNNSDYKKLRDLVKEKSKEEGFSSHTIDAVLRQLDQFRRSLKSYGLLGMRPSVTREFIEKVTDIENPSLVIVDMSDQGLPGPPYIKQFVVYYIALIMFNLFVEYRRKAMIENVEQRVALLVIEEAQNFAPNLQTYKLGYSVARNLLATIATQGRKFGLSLVLVTQRPLYVDPVVMSMMNTFIIHRVPPYDVRFVENLTGGIAYGLSRNLSVMERGNAIIVGQMNPSPLPLVVKVRSRGGSYDYKV
ncbi:MAG: ATP-binding protein [Desulfurococcales archaeon]|nr:ATP-binding protein [Desulfurococcales archaeon]